MIFQDGYLVRLNLEFANQQVRGKTIFAATPVELEMALYTVCLYARTDDWCPISLGGAKFSILVESNSSNNKKKKDIRKTVKAATIFFE